MPEQFVYSRDDVLRMLDALLASRGSAWWGEFFADRAKPCPFFTDRPAGSARCGTRRRSRSVCSGR